MKIYEPYFLHQTHQYHSPDGMILDSVTTILKEEFGLYHYGNNSKANFGTDVHTARQYYNDNDLDESTLTPEVSKRLEQYKLAKKELGIIVKAQELRRYCPKYLYAGTLDELDLIKSRLGVLDIKTGKEEKWHCLQTAAYANMIKHEHPEPLARWCLYLADDSYKLVEHTNKGDFATFLALAAAHQIKVNFGYRKRKE